MRRPTTVSSAGWRPSSTGPRPTIRTRGAPRRSTGSTGPSTTTRCAISSTWRSTSRSCCRPTGPATASTTSPACSASRRRCWSAIWRLLERSAGWRWDARRRRPPPRSFVSPATCRRTTGWRACRSAPAAAGRFATCSRRTPTTRFAFAWPATPATTWPSSRCRTRWRRAWTARWSGPSPSEDRRLRTRRATATSTARGATGSGPSTATGSSACRSRPGRTSCA